MNKLFSFSFLYFYPFISNSHVIPLTYLENTPSYSIYFTWPNLTILNYHFVFRLFLECVCFFFSSLPIFDQQVQWNLAPSAFISFGQACNFCFSCRNKLHDLIFELWGTCHLREYMSYTLGKALVYIELSYRRQHSEDFELLRPVRNCSDSFVTHHYFFVQSAFHTIVISLNLDYYSVSND